MAIDSKYYFQISTSSGVPIYRQIMDQVKIHTAAGRLNQNNFLPSVRQVAKEVEVNPMTVSKAYSLLEKEGVLESVRGQGMRVILQGRLAKNVHQHDKEIAPLLKEVIMKAKQLSLTKKNMIDIVQKLWKE